MKIETLKQNKKKQVTLGILITVSVLSMAIFISSYAKYRSTNSINIARGTIKYNRPDLHLTEVYVSNDAGEYKLATEIPSSGYILNEDKTKTRCENKDGSLAYITITYDSGSLSFSKLTTSGIKCYIYLDKKKASTVIPEGTPTVDNMFAGIEGNGIYIWTKGDYSGGTQLIKYFRGNVDNNWVVFGRDGSNYIWWRIIRNNSNGSLRMIYAGVNSNKTSAPAKTGIGTQIGKSIFNPNSRNNMHVGFKYTENQVHGTGTNSTILEQLETWYNKTIGLNSVYSNKIDINAGFCNDRTPHTGSGLGETSTFYAAYNRLDSNKNPTLLCSNSKDIFKTNIGLITADEVAMGGMVFKSLPNTNSYLYTGDAYWTMSPYYCPSTNVFYVDSYLSRNGVDGKFGIRPVINLKADTTFVSGNGEATTPFVVQDT